MADMSEEALEELAEMLSKLEHARKSFVEARGKMNVHRPAIDAPAEDRQYYQHLYQLDNEAEREMRTAAVNFASWCEARSISAALKAHLTQRSIDHE